MSTPPAGSSPPEHVGHETRDISLRGILITGGVLVVIAVVVHVGLWLLFEWYAESVAQLDRPVPPLAEPQVPPAPRLQPKPPGDYALFRREEDKLLHGYGWVDPEEEIVHIPIERAMEIIAEEGVPWFPEPETPPHTRRYGVPVGRTGRDEEQPSGDAQKPQTDGQPQPRRGEEPPPGEQTPRAEQPSPGSLPPGRVPHQEPDGRPAERRATSQPETAPPQSP